MRLVGLPFGKYEFTVEALSVFRVVDKLARAGIEVRSFRILTKNSAVFTVNGKDTKKVFAILRGSCYNIKKVRPKGLSLLTQKLTRYAGLLAGIVLFFAAVFFFESRVLDIRVVGSGAYYEDEIRRILSDNGIERFSALPEDCAPVTARIISLPRVSFCTVGKNGGIVTVTVEVTDDEPTLTSEPLLSPATGVVEELAVIRGTPRVQIGDAVGEGDEIVSNETAFGEEGKIGNVIVIARVVVACPFAREYAGSEESALLNAALEFGNMRDIHTTQTGEGWLVEGVALIEKSLNLG